MGFWICVLCARVFHHKLKDLIHISKTQSVKPSSNFLSLFQATSWNCFYSVNSSLTSWHNLRNKWHTCHMGIGDIHSNANQISIPSVPLVNIHPPLRKSVCLFVCYLLKEKCLFVICWRKSVGVWRRSQVVGQPCCRAASPEENLSG